MWFRLILFLLVPSLVWGAIEIRATGRYNIGDGVPPEPPPCTDVDGDGYGSPASYGCQYWTLDCNDNNAAINPGAGEICGDDIDQNCDGYDLPCNGGEVKVFPGAEGFGTNTPAGRGGQILHVTKLTDDGSTGTLREVLTRDLGGSSIPRIIVFDVSGSITLGSKLAFSTNYVTIAGQTAPAPGIMLRNHGLRITGHDVLVQHVAIRVGDTDTTSESDDGVQILGGAYNVVIDHVSAAWGTDENMDIWSDGTHDVTISNCILAEGLLTHSCGLLLGDWTENISILRNFFVHNRSRSPARIKGGSKSIVINNVGYNAEGDFIALTDDYANLPMFTSVIGNVMRDGPDTDSKGWNTTYISVESTCKAGTKIYHSDNVSDESGQPTFKESVSFDPVATSPPVSIAGITILTAAQTEAQIPTTAGSRPAFRDAVDLRAASTFAARNGKLITSQSEVGGYPSYAQNTSVFNPPANPSSDPDGDGYTNMDDVLYQCSQYLITGTGSCPR